MKEFVDDDCELLENKLQFVLTKVVTFENKFKIQ